MGQTIPFLWDMSVGKSNLGIGIAKLDGNISDNLVLKANCLHTGKGLHHSRFTVGHMTNGTDIESGLSANHLWGNGGQLLLIL